jgi:hypothetical protein
VIATPGRLIDLMGREDASDISFSSVSMLVLDEVRVSVSSILVLVVSLYLCALSVPTEHVPANTERACCRWILCCIWASRSRSSHFLFQF